MQQICSKCKLLKPKDEFRPDSGRKRGTFHMCRLCESEYKAKWHKINSASRNPKAAARAKEYKNRNAGQIVEYLKDKACIDCGEADPIVLDFDHIDRANKKMAVSEMLVRTYSWVVILEEIAKCEIRCANCHRRRTYKQLGHYRRG